LTVRWWGWGEDSGAIHLGDAAAGVLHAELGLGEARRTATVSLEDVRLPEPTLNGRARRALAQAVGEKHVRDDRLSRISHAAGRSYPDLVRLRAGDASHAPDAVVHTGSEAEVATVLAVCSRAGVAVTPFGGGTSVVGGVEALRGSHVAAISLDLTRMDTVLDVDQVSLTAALEPGILGPELERRLGAAGLTLGHFPQSFEFSTVGGWVATRSAGQASTGYGRIDDLVESVSCITPTGALKTRDVPVTAAGPSLRELVVGSEGALGVITAATLRVRPLPEVRHYEAWSFSSFEEGAEAYRIMEQAGASPDVARLSDEEETRLSKALASSGSVAERLGESYLRIRGQQDGCLAFTGYEGTSDDVARRRKRAAVLLRAAGAVSLGQRPARSWLKGRFSAPYLRDDMLGHGAMVETLETATTWSNLHVLYRAVREALTGALASRGTPPLVLCHMSHLYRSGASLYFTFLARQEAGAELDQWRTAKRAAGDAILANGGTITHHHAVGADHVPWMTREVGDLGVEVLRAAKERLDPEGIMNPGKLIPERSRPEAPG
jgi:alkyldihydroxyacetonephosphate synthase